MNAGLGRLHVITDESLQSRYSHADLARCAAAGGADVVQFREKRLRTTQELIRTARALREVLHGGPARLLIDDRVDVAIAAGVPAVHLGRDDLDVATARALLGPAALLGGTANSLDEARAVAAAAVDYLGVGPVFGTTTKANPAPTLGLDGLRAIVAAVNKPVIAIGGITAGQVAAVMAAGAYGVAVVSAVVCQPDPTGATRAFRRAIDAALREAPHA